MDQRNAGRLADAHFCLNPLLHRVVLGHLPHICVNKCVCLTHGKFILRTLELQCLMQHLALVHRIAFDSSSKGKVAFRK